MSLYGNSPYYLGSLKNYVVYFGRIFNDIRITRNNEDGEQDTLVRVPLSYSGRDKNLLRVDIKDGSPEMENCPPGFLVFPHMGFEMTGMEYDSDRNQGIHNKIVRKNDDDLDTVKRVFSPAPYNLSFSLYVMSKNIEDGNKIIEQIVPFFKPHFTSSVKISNDPNIDITMDIPVNLDSITFEDKFRGELTERRNVFWTLNFTMSAYFYGPQTTKPIIKSSDMNFYVGNTSTTNTAVMSVTVTPGLDANGNPTSNSAVTIPSANIAIDSDFGYIESWSDETDT